MGWGADLMSMQSTRVPEFTLAIDTSAGTSVAVLSMGSVLAEVNYLEPMTHAERIGSAIAEVLSKASLEADEISLVVVGVGPGPFTGLRVGLAAAQFFALGANADLVGVCSLDAIALDYYKKYPSDASLLVTTDARRKEIFWASYQGVKDSIPIRVTGPMVNKEVDVENFITVETHQRTDIVVRAGALGEIAFAQMLTDLGPNYDVTPIYLREPDAVPGKAKRVSG